MKKIKFLISGSVIFIFCHGYRAQNMERQKQITSMLTEFYTAYSKVKFTVEDQQKWDSITKIYCTNQFLKEAKKYRAEGHDVLTNDFDLDQESINTLKVEIFTSNHNKFVVSYEVDTYPVSPKRSVKQKVFLQVETVKQNGSDKINAVK